MIALELVLQAREQLRVHPRVHLAAQNLLRAGQRQRRDLRAQRLARARHFLLDLGLRTGDQPLHPLAWPPPSPLR